MADITAIGAGGGSIARVEEGGYLRVGPESAGADPGPACYGRGGTYPTVTDADLVLGILDPERFLEGRLRLDRQAAEHALARHVARPLGISVEEAAVGVKRIVDNRMADLVRTVTLERGHDPRSFVLYAFGGAGPMHAPSFALDLVEAIVVPATQSVHSALGAITSDVHVVCERSEPMRIARSELPDVGRVSEIFDELAQSADVALAAQGVEAAARRFERWVEMRYARQTKELRIPFVSPETLCEQFENEYSRRFGSEAVPSGVGYELVTFSVEGRGDLPRPQLEAAWATGGKRGSAHRGTRAAYDPLQQQFVDHAVYDGTALRPESRIAGPAIIEFPTTTVALPERQLATVDRLGNITIGWRL
jgi:N-methylhydantoinase A